MTQQQNEFELFADIKRTAIEGGMSEEMFNEFIAQVESKLRLTFSDITSRMLHQAVTLQAVHKKDKVSFVSVVNDTSTPEMRCLLCEDYPVYAASYKDPKQERALFYFACNKHNVMNEVEEYANQFYEIRKGLDDNK